MQTKHRFPIGTQFFTRSKNPYLCTVTEQYTTTDSRGKIVRMYYAAQHSFLGQVVVDHDVVDTTIARGLIPEYQYLLKE